MRAIALLGLVVAVAGASAGLAGGASSGARVSIVRLDPLRVDGAGFTARRPVRVDVTWRSGHVARTVTATARGRFSARFALSGARFVCRGLKAAATQDGHAASAHPQHKACGAIVAPLG